METSVGCHLRNIKAAVIEAHTSRTDSRPDGYPVLSIGPVTFWPTVGQMREIRDAVTQWLETPDGRRLAAIEAEIPEAIAV